MEEEEEKSRAQKQTYKSTLMPTTVTMATDDTMEELIPTAHTYERYPTISDLMEPTTEDSQDNNNEMEDDNVGLATKMPLGILKAIRTITPNIQWQKDLPKDLPKRRHGIEIKINSANAPTESDSIPAYHHPHIFKAIAAIQTAAPGTLICSIKDDEEAIVEATDIPPSKTTIDHYQEAPTINRKTHTYHI
jgi:hypothetical protein